MGERGGGREREREGGVEGHQADAEVVCGGVGHGVVGVRAGREQRVERVKDDGRVHHLSMNNREYE